MSFPAKSCVFVFLCVFLLGLGTAEGQLPQRGGRKQEPERFTAEGKIAGVTRGMIKLVNAADQTWIVKVEPSTDISVQGTAAPEFLKRGMVIQMSAAVDKKGRVPEKVAELKIITRREDTVMGAFPQQAAGGFEEAAAPAPGAGATATTPYDLVGILSGARKGKYILNVVRGIVQFELAEDAKINLDVADYWLGKEGDKIVVSGTVVREGPLRTPQGQIDGMGNAQTVAIDLTEKLAGPTTKKQARSRASRRRPRGQNDQEASEPANAEEKEEKEDAKEKEDPDKKEAQQ